MTIPTIDINPKVEVGRTEHQCEAKEPSKDNSLYLTIKQCFFDEIAVGTKGKEYREIKPTTYRKYLDCTPDGTPFGDDSIITLEEVEKGDIWVRNNGKYLFFPKRFKKNFDAFAL